MVQGTTRQPGLPLEECPQGHRTLSLAAGENPLGDLHMQAATLNLEKRPALPNPPRAKASGKPPHDLPLGNFGRIPERGGPTPKNPAPSGAPSPAPGDAGWIDAEFGVQYRLRMPDARIEKTADGAERRTIMPEELPLLLYLDLRNVGDKSQNLKLELGLSSHQSQHTLIVDGVVYEKRDQPGAGVDLLPPDAGIATLPFVLFGDWKRQPAQIAPGNQGEDEGAALRTRRCRDPWSGNRGACR